MRPSLAGSCKSARSVARRASPPADAHPQVVGLRCARVAHPRPVATNPGAKKNPPCSSGFWCSGEEPIQVERLRKGSKQETHACISCLNGVSPDAVSKRFPKWTQLFHFVTGSSSGDGAELDERQNTRTCLLHHARYGPCRWPPLTSRRSRPRSVFAPDLPGVGHAPTAQSLGATSAMLGGESIVFLALQEFVWVARSFSG